MSSRWRRAWRQSNRTRPSGPLEYAAGGQAGVRAGGQAGRRAGGRAERTVEEDEVCAGAVEVVGVEEVDVLDAEREAEPLDWRLVVVGGHVRGEREVLDQAAAVATGNNEGRDVSSAGDESRRPLGDEQKASRRRVGDECVEEVGWGAGCVRAGCRLCAGCVQAVCGLCAAVCNCGLAVVFGID